METIHEIDLSSLPEQERQRNNAAKFQHRKIRLLFGFASVFVIIVIARFSVPAYHKILICLAFVAMVATVFLMLMYKCPNCGTAQAGQSISLSSEIRYNKGVNPFAKRCSCCGFYLSPKYLERRISEANMRHSP